MSQYKHKSIQKLLELHQQHKSEIKEMKEGGIGQAYSALSLSIPPFLEFLDSEEELYPLIKKFFEAITEAFKEDAT